MEVRICVCPIAYAGVKLRNAAGHVFLAVLIVEAFGGLYEELVMPSQTQRLSGQNIFEVVRESLLMQSHRGGNMKSPVKIRVAGAMVLLGAGLIVTGCKSAPPLTQQQAQVLIQAKYDQAAPAPITITLTDRGMVQSVNENYWERTRIYPNRLWADFTLTIDGKKLISIPGGGDVI